MKTRRITPLIALLVAGSLSLAACSNADTNTGAQSNATGGDSSSNAAATATSAEEFGGMDKLVEAAKKEGALNVIALPHDWSNYGAVIAGFKEKYPEITVNEMNPNASSKEEIDAIKTNAGTDKSPDVVDIGMNVAWDENNMKLFAPYKVANWEHIAAGAKHPEGLFTGDYTGIMTIGWNKTKYGDITSLEDLKDPKFKGVVALNGKPAEAGAAFNGFLMVNRAKGGDMDNLQPGLDLFTELKNAGTLNTKDVTDATIVSGEHGVVMDWSYNQVGYAKKMQAQNQDWQFMVLPGSEVAQYYNQAVVKDAPHPAAARLWQEWLFSPEAQNLWLAGGSQPSLLAWMKEQGTVDQQALAAQVKVENEPFTYDAKQAAAATEWLKANWDKAIGN